jgi:hypothetical protein
MERSQLKHITQLGQTKQCNFKAGSTRLKYRNTYTFATSTFGLILSDNTRMQVVLGCIVVYDTKLIADSIRRRHAIY